MVGLNTFDLETVTQNEISSYWEKAVGNPALWSMFSALFDSKINEKNLRV